MLRDSFLKQLTMFIVVVASAICLYAGIEVYAGTNGYSQEAAVNYARGLVGQYVNVDASGYDCDDIQKVV